MTHPLTQPITTTEKRMEPTFMNLLVPYLPYLGDRELTPQTRLRDVGLDSMQAIELVLTIEDAYGATFPDEHMIDETFETAGSLWAAVSTIADAVAAGASGGATR
jgi:acyl carrier protein